MRTRGRRRGLHRFWVLGCALAAVLLAGCTNTPPPPLVNEESSTSSAPPEPTAKQLTVGVDSVAGGYNPHKLADQSTITTALSQILLPSPFRPDSSGNLQLDRTVMRGAEVTNAEPFTVTYRIRSDAAWSDGAPIAAEDFLYLWQQMRTAAGVVDPSGYQLITNIDSRDGGKVVVVRFAEPYPGWRHLFGDLLPAHLLKDAPGGWGSALESGFPAVAGPFSIKNLDAARGEIILQRNERYWAQPAELDQLVLRRTDQQGIIDALRSNNNELALVNLDGAGKRKLDKLVNSEQGAGIELHTVPRPTVATVLLRPVGPVLAEQDVRSALAALINREALIAAGADGGPAADLRARAQVRPPSDPRYRRTMPGNAPAARHDPGRAHRLLIDAGYHKTEGSWLDEQDEPLRLTVAAPAETEPYVGIADELVRQLTDAGIEAELRTPQARELYGDLATRPSVPVDQQREADPAVNILVGPQPAGGGAANTLAARFGCRTLPGGTTAGDEGDRPNQPPPPANAAAFCDPDVQESITDVLTGRQPFADVLPDVERRLWARSVAVPLFQSADTFAIRPEVAGAAAGPPMAGPFRTATEWRRSAS